MSQNWSLLTCSPIVWVDSGNTKYRFDEGPSDEASDAWVMIVVQRAGVSFPTIVTVFSALYSLTVTSS